MSSNALPMFMSFWFSLFFLSTALFNSFIPLEDLDMFNNVLVSILCITCSYEAARSLTTYLMKDM